MKTQRTILHLLLNEKTGKQRPLPCFFLFVLIIFFVGFLGCKGKTISPTSPAIETPVPTTTPLSTETPDNGETPTSANMSCDNYAEDANDPDVKALEVDGESYLVSMDCTGDVDWYKIELSSLPTALTVSLSGIPEDRDFDIFAYDSQLSEFENGRSEQSGNVEEQLSLVVETETLIFLKIYSFNGRGNATLTINAEDIESDDDDDDDDDNGTGNDFEQLTYEDVLSTVFSFYPRGTTAGLLEQSVETVVVEPVECQISDTELSGELTIGHYAHVERELLESIDYIDGWALAVFNGSKELLDMLTVTIRVTIFAPTLDLEITVPSEMEIQGDDYLVSETRTNVYYTSQAYGDFFGNTHRDIQIFSGVVGDLGELFSNNIFTQQVEIEWRYEDDDGTVCSGSVSGDPIIDFKRNKLFFFPHNY